MSDTEAKTETASKQKLVKQRQKGSVAPSQEIASLFANAVGLICLVALGSIIFHRLAQSIVDTMNFKEAAIEDVLALGLSQLSRVLFVVISPIVGVSLVVAVVVTLLYNRGVVFSLDPVKPKLSRVSMNQGIKRVYGRRGWLEFGVSSGRLIVWFFFVGIVGYVWLPEFISSPFCDTTCIAQLFQPLAWIAVILAIIIILVAGAIEAVIQKNQFMHEQRMTKSEVKRERKDQLGSAEVRKERRRLRSKYGPGGQHTAPGVENAQFCFFTKDVAVAVRFVPPKETVPFVVGKVSGPENVLELRKQMEGPRRRELESQQMVDRLRGYDLGDAIRAEHLGAFDRALVQIFDPKGAQ